MTVTFGGGPVARAAEGRGRRGAASLFAVLATLLLLLAAAPQATLADAAPTGRTLKEVAFSAGDATPLGGYRLVQPGTWQEFAQNGTVTFTYTEERRDDWTVYLRDASRNVEIRLDLHKRQVLYGAGGQEPYPIYVILYAMSDAPTGYTVTRVDFSLDGQIEAGRFLSAGGGRWVEVNNYDQIGFTFAETSRDDGSVYLHDASRNVSLQLDLVTDTVYYAVGSGTLTPLYKIILEQ